MANIVCIKFLFQVEIRKKYNTETVDLVKQIKLHPTG